MEGDQGTKEGVREESGWEMQQGWRGDGTGMEEQWRGQEEDGEDDGESEGGWRGMEISGEEGWEWGAAVMEGGMEGVEGG